MAKVLGDFVGDHGKLEAAAHHRHRSGEGSASNQQGSPHGTTQSHQKIPARRIGRHWFLSLTRCKPTRMVALPLTLPTAQFSRDKVPIMVATGGNLSADSPGLRLQGS